MRVNILVCLLLLSGLSFSCKPQDAGRQEATPPASTSALNVSDEPGSAAPETRRVRVAMLPKLKGITYFTLCEEGARRAAQEENVELLWDAPLETNTPEQVSLIDTWLVRGIDVLCIASNDPAAIAPAIAKCKRNGVHVLTWDTDSPGTQRDYMVNQVDGRVLGRQLMDILADEMGGQGRFAIITGGLEAENLNFWMRHIQERHQEAYPEMELIGVWPCDSIRQRAMEVAGNLLREYPDLGGIIGNDSAAFDGACDAILQAGKAGQVKITGLSNPNVIRKFVRDGVVNRFLLWDPRDLGYLTVKVAANLARGIEPADGQPIEGFGPLQFDPEDPTVIIMAEPTEFNTGNIDEFDF